MFPGSERQPPFIPHFAPAFPTALAPPPTAGLEFPGWIVADPAGQKPCAAFVTPLRLRYKGKFPYRRANLL